MTNHRYDGDHPDVLREAITGEHVALISPRSGHRGYCHNPRGVQSLAGVVAGCDASCRMGFQEHLPENVR
jgi:hypothetical protein